MEQAILILSIWLVPALSKIATSFIIMISTKLGSSCSYLSQQA